MPRKSKVEKSPHYNEILDMIEKSISPRHISDYLKNEYDESISHTTINNFIKKIKSKTISEYHKQQKAKSKNNTDSKLDEVVDKEIANKKAFDEVVCKGVDDLNALDDIIGLAEKVKLDPSKIQVKHGPQGGVIVSEFDVLRANAMVANIVLKAISVKTNKLKDEPEAPDVNVNFYTEEVNNLLKKNTQN